MYRAPNTREGNVEVTDTAVIFHGLNRWQPKDIVPVRAIQSVTLTQPPIGGQVPVSMEVITADGRKFSRHSINGRKVIVKRFMEEAYQPLLALVGVHA